MHPPGPTGETAILLAVDAFTKYVVGQAIREMSGHAVASWFHTEITCKFGLPHTVRVDRGTEFDGDFITYCREMGIRMREISTAWPRA